MCGGTLSNELHCLQSFGFELGNTIVHAGGSKLTKEIENKVRGQLENA